MAGIGWVVPLIKEYDVSLTFNWWNPLNKIEIRKSFYFNREAINQDTEIIFSYILSLICVSLEFIVYRNGGIND